MAQQAVVAEPVPAAVTELERSYEFREPDAVRSFLARHTDLIEVLVEASVTIPAFLPSRERLVLEILRDPEDGGEGELFAIVPTQLEPEEVLPRLARMREEWWIPLARRVGGRLNVDVEYR